MYMNGLGVEKDRARAKHYYGLARHTNAHARASYHELELAEERDGVTKEAVKEEKGQETDKQGLRARLARWWND